MPIEISGRRVFLASPGDMAPEREVCRQVVRAFNDERTEAEGVTFIIRAWEDLPGGIGRPQDRINPKVDDCDFMILLLGDRWGTPPGLRGPYSSGTEEEFHRCIELLAKPEAAMRDLLVMFKTLDVERLRDPGPQLLRVMHFRDSLEKSKALQYVTFDSNESLSAALTKKLIEWAEPLDVRQPFVITLPDAEGSVGPPEQATQQQLLNAAREHVANGLLMQAEAAYAHAIEGGNVDAVSEYALLMRRTGRLEQALDLNKRVLDDPLVLSATDQNSTVHRINALANIGVIHRKRGALSDSVEALREAVRTAEASKFPVYRELCYALDNYGISLQRSGAIDLARRQFEKAHSLRREYGTGRDLAQSAVNLGRQALLLEDYGRASEFFNEALAINDVTSDEHLHANVLCGLAEARLRQGSQEDVHEMLDRALDLNTNRGNSDGISIAQALLARLFLLTGTPDRAVEHAELCRRESGKTSSSTGHGTAALLLAMVSRAKGRSREAREYIVQAAQYARKSGNKTLIKEVEGVTQELSMDADDDDPLRT